MDQYQKNTIGFNDLVRLLKERNDIFSHKPLNTQQQSDLGGFIEDHAPRNQLTKPLAGDMFFVCEPGTMAIFRIRSSASLTSDSNLIGELRNGDCVTATQKTRDGSGWEWLHITSPCEGYVLYTLQHRLHRFVSEAAIRRGSAFRQLSDAEKPRYCSVLLRPSSDDFGNLVKVLYHQTSEEAARSIVGGRGKMLRGSHGAVGAGIYFAETPEETRLKAKQQGVILVCRVFVGQPLVTSSTDHDYTYGELKAMGYDSVLMTAFSSGKEYVVFSCDQVMSVERYEK